MEYLFDDSVCYILSQEPVALFCAVAEVSGEGIFEIRFISIITYCFFKDPFIIHKDNASG